MKRPLLPALVEPPESPSRTGKPIDVRVDHHFVVRGGLIVRFDSSPTPPSSATP